MKHFTMVTEGETDRLLLEHLFRTEANQNSLSILTGGGWSGADALARSLLVRGVENVVLVVDADSIEPGLVEERRQFLHRSLHDVATRNDWLVCVIAPEIEALLFRESAVLAQLVGHSVSESDLLRGAYEPKKTLDALLRPVSLAEAYRNVLPALDLTPLRNLPEIREIASFLRGARPKAEARHYA